MIEIATAANVVEAQLLADELRSGGIEVFVSGGYLTGAIGELPPDSVLRLYINNEQHRERATEMIAQFDAARRKEIPRRWCAHCEEWIDGQFGHCWQCGASMPIVD